MSYNVMVSSKVYRNTDMYKDWRSDSLGLGYTFSEYVHLKYPDVYNYISFISDDLRYPEVLNLGHYDRILGSDDIASSRYRLFKFHSEEHFTWFVLRWC